MSAVGARSWRQQQWSTRGQNLIWVWGVNWVDPLQADIPAHEKFNKGVGLNNEGSSRNVSMKTLIILNGMMQGKQLAALKNGSCNTNAVSKSFVEASRHLLKQKI